MTSGSETTVTGSTGDIPVLVVRARSLPQAWEKAIVALWNHGTEVRTEAERKRADHHRDDGVPEAPPGARPWDERDEASSGRARAH